MYIITDMCIYIHMNIHIYIHIYLYIYIYSYLFELLSCLLSVEQMSTYDIEYILLFAVYTESRIDVMYHI